MIPKHIVDRDKEGVESLTYYGVPALELSHDELLAAFACSERKSQLQFRNYKARREFEVDCERKINVVFDSIPGLERVV